MTMNLNERSHCVVNHDEDLTVVDFDDDVNLVEKEVVVLSTETLLCFRSQCSAEFDVEPPAKVNVIGLDVEKPALFLYDRLEVPKKQVVATVSRPRSMVMMQWVKGRTAVEATIEEEEGSGGKHGINNGGDDLHGLQGEINCLRKRRRSRLSWKKASVLPSNVSRLKASGMPRQRNEEADGVQREKRKPLSSLIHHQFIQVKIGGFSSTNLRDFIIHLENSSKLSHRKLITLFFRVLVRGGIPRVKMLNQ
ncbi:hypothetical protein B296_00035123 [Ensete ventricosum]|uniref:Uncharacterized protein n=1 Tax=Ensete ventricosum TaxID=4639 RepID=A0A426YZX9_ENSVE|nr:hypothetical protein B296_00035123 [Ensete ventricosum]